MKTLYYYIHHDEIFSKAYPCMMSAQLAVTESGTPHHVKDIIAVTYKESCGMTDGVERITTHPVWWKHWRDLEVAKQQLKTSKGTGDKQ